MKEFLEKLRQQVAENPPNYGDADSVLGLLLRCSSILFIHRPSVIVRTIIMRAECSQERFEDGEA